MQNINAQTTIHEIMVRISIVTVKYVIQKHKWVTTVQEL